MNVSPTLLPNINSEYVTSINLDLYNAPNCQELATQAAAGRHLRFLSAKPQENAFKVQLCEDDYIAWLPLEQIKILTTAVNTYQGLSLSRSQIEAKIPEIIAFTKTAMSQPNYYLWGGNIGPNYDCSGLMQAAFVASGIWIPRDSYQQEEFTTRINREELQAGDLIFFAEARVNHVALYLGDNYYIHSSGKERGRNGIGIDQLSENGDPVSRAYYHDLYSFGRVMNSYLKSC